MRPINLRWAPFCALLLACLHAEAAGGSSASSAASSPTASAPGASGSSSITVGTNSGIIENYLLAQQQISLCGQDIATKVASEDNLKAFVILEQSQKDQLQALAQLNAQSALAVQIVTDTKEDFDKKVTNAGLYVPTPDYGVVGVGLIAGISAVQSLLSLFQETVTVGGNQLSTTDEMLIDSTAAYLVNVKKKKVFRPGIFQPDAFDQAVIGKNSLFSKLEALAKARNALSTYSSDNKANIIALNNFLNHLSSLKSLDATQTQYQTAAKNALQVRTDIQPDLDGAVAAADGVLQPLLALPKASTSDATGSSGAPGQKPAAAQPPAAATSSPTSSLTLTATIAATSGATAPTSAPTTNASTSSDGSKASFADIVAAALLVEKAKALNGAVLTLHTEQVGGGYETRSNLWTFFGSKPISYSGGAVVTFSTYDANSGAVLASGVCGGYSGNVSASDVGAHGVQPPGQK